MNTWEVTDLANVSEALTPPASGLNANLTGTGNWLSPVTAVDYVNLAWYIILQSTVPLRQLILKKDVSALTSFMSKIDLTESSSTLFPDELLFEGWETISDLNETAPFVGRGVATMMRDSIVIISGTANSFTPGDANIVELRGCDHAYLFSTVDHTWKRQELVRLTQLSLDNNKRNMTTLTSVYFFVALPVSGQWRVPRHKREGGVYCRCDYGTLVHDGMLCNIDSFFLTRTLISLLVGPKIFMHGGIKPYQTVLQDFWILDTDTWTWTRLLDGPGPRADHTLLQYHEYIFAVSGLSTTCY